MISVVTVTTPHTVRCTVCGDKGNRVQGTGQADAAGWALVAGKLHEHIAAVSPVDAARRLVGLAERACNQP